MAGRCSNRGKEARAQHLFDIAAQQGRLDGAAHQARALAQNGDRVLLHFGFRLQQFFLGDAAVIPQRLVLAAIDARALFGQALRHHAGQGQIDVVAAQQDVLAHGDAVER